MRNNPFQDHKRLMRGGTMFDSIHCARRMIPAMIITFFSLFFSCNSTKFIVDHNMMPLTRKMNAAIQANPDIKLVCEGMPSGILQLEGMLEASPDNVLLMRKLAEAYYGYAFACVEDRDPEHAAALYKRAMEYARMALVFRHPELDGKWDGPLDSFSAIITECGPDDAIDLFLAGAAWLSWVGKNVDDPEALLALPKVEVLLTRAIQIDDTVYEGGAHACLGVYYATQPEGGGGDITKAEKHFQKAFAVSGHRLLTYDFLYARYYAYRLQDRKIFLDSLNRVLDTPLEIYPEKRFVNAVAKMKARRLKDDVDRFIAGGE